MSNSSAAHRLEENRRPNGQFGPGTRPEAPDLGLAEDAPTAEEASWARLGFDADESREWSDAGFNSYTADQWRYHGFQAPIARIWADRGFAPGLAREWGQRWFNADEASEWDRRGFNADEASQWRASIGGAVSALAADRMRREGFGAQQAGEWLRSGGPVPPPSDEETDGPRGRDGTSPGAADLVGARLERAIARNGPTFRPDDRQLPEPPADAD